MTTVENADTRTTPEPSPAPRRAVAPLVNITETKEGYTLEAEVPGVSKDGVEVTVEDNELTIVGRRQRTDTKEHKEQSLYRESDDADYRRVFELDAAIDATKITAKVDQGVLTIHLPFSERVKPRKITVSE